MIAFKILPIILLSGLLLLLVACGGDPTIAPTVVPTTVPTAAPTAQPTAVPSPTRVPTAAATPTPTPSPTDLPPVPKAVEGGTLVTLGNEPPTLDPHLTGDTTSARYVLEIFGGLLTIDKELAIVPDLAEEWSVSDSGDSFTFRLKPEAAFHNGRQVTSQDVKWSIERAADPATEAPTADVFLGDIVGVNEMLAGTATEVAGVSIIDDRTLTIGIDSPKVSFIAKLTYPTSFVVDRETVTDDPQWVFEPNATGPFRLTGYEPGEFIVLSRFEDYHLGPAHLDEVRFILSGGNARMMFENEEIHVTREYQLGLETLLDPSHPLRDRVLLGPPQFDVEYIGMNVTKPPFDDPKVRQALNYAVDRETLATRLREGTSVPAKGIIPPGFPGFNPGLEGYSFDPEKAKRLLAESKYGDDLENLPLITLTLPGSFSAAIGPTMEAVLNMWESHLGIRMELLQTEWAIFLQDLHDRRFQMYGGLSWIADYMDPENFLDVLFHSESSDNHDGYSNPEVDRLLELAEVEQSEPSRLALYNQAEEMIVADSPWVPLWHTSGGYVLAQPNVKDYFLFPLVIPQLRYVYFVE